MIDGVNEGAVSPTDGATLPPSNSPGAQLRRAREAAGLHVAALAVSLKVPVKRLEQIEADDWDSLPSPVFARGLVSSVARHLKIDAQPILDQMPQPKTGFNFDGGGFQPPLSHKALQSSAFGSTTGNSHRLKWIVAFLVLGSALLLAWPWLQQRFPVLNTWLNKTSVSVPASSETVPDASAPAVASVQMVPSEAASAAASPAVASTPAPQAQAFAPGPAIAPIAVAVPSPAPEAASGDAVMTIQAPASTWVTVRDADKKLLFEKTLPAGEVAQIAGQLPLSVVIGRGDVAQVMVKGQSFDLKPHLKGSVARFEVK